MTTLYIYAELLFHVRSVTVLALLPTRCTPDTRVLLLPTGRSLCITHGGQSEEINLPCHVINHANLNISKLPRKELSFRLSPTGSPGSPNGPCSPPATRLPWPASALSADTRISCQTCKHILLKPIATWKDLPSGNWADMMDFWHCHKPTIPGKINKTVGSTKGYAAANVMCPCEGIGLVGVSDLLLARDDCIGVSVSAFNFLFDYVSRLAWVTRRRLAFHLCGSRGKVADTITLEWTRKSPAIFGLPSMHLA